MRKGLTALTTCSVRFRRIIIPDKIIKGSSVGTIRLNQSCRPVREKARLSFGKASKRPVRRINVSVRKKVFIFFLKESPFL